jgi:hypothetical protein
MRCYRGQLCRNAARSFGGAFARCPVDSVCAVRCVTPTSSTPVRLTVCPTGASSDWSPAVLKRMHRIFGRDWNLVSVKLTCADRFSPAHWEGKMKFFGAALVCLAVLYGVDAFFFDGRYGHGLDSAISDIQRRW